MRNKTNDPARLELMQEAICNIESFIAGTDSYDAFAANKVLCHAVCYNLQCIGESAYMLSRQFVADHPGIQWKSIEGLRHVLVHDYYNVKIERIWAIVKEDLPKLKKQLQELM